MSADLTISIGQCSDRGIKSINQDFHGSLVPEQPALGSKGIAIAIADGISSSSVSQVAAETAIKSFLTDYYCTSDTWSVKTSAYRVIAATNSWLFSQTRRGGHAEDLDRGYVCTLSAMVLKSRTAHIFHVGDARVFRIASSALEQLTSDHRVWVTAKQSYLGRALGMAPSIEIDYREVRVAPGDQFVLATDGVYDHVTHAFVADVARRHAGNLDAAARLIVEQALAHGSEDNLTVLIVRVDHVPLGDVDEYVDDGTALIPPPLLEAGKEIDGLRIVRTIHSSSRSHIYLVEEVDSGHFAALKIPSIDMRDDESYLRRFKMEEWIARRITSAHVLQPHTRTRRRTALYSLAEVVDGQTLAQWMIDNPVPDLETVRGIVEQIAKGLRAFHRKEMLHQDLRPANIMIDRAGTVKIIDFGSVRVAGVIEADADPEDEHILGTAQYTAPEYFIGEAATPKSDHFSLGVIAYQMLTGALPYGATVARINRPSQLRSLRYVSARRFRPELPDWIDGALRKAVHPDASRRYEALSEFEFDLRHPRAQFTAAGRQPLLERNPLLFWQMLSLALACAVLVLLFLHLR